MTSGDISPAGLELLQLLGDAVNENYHVPAVRVTVPDANASPLVEVTGNTGSADAGAGGESKLNKKKNLTVDLNKIVDQHGFSNTDLTSNGNVASKSPIEKNSQSASLSLTPGAASQRA